MKRRYALAISLLAVLAALAVIEGRLRTAGLAERLPTGSAEWIWAPDATAAEGWADFFVFKDFELEEVPPTVGLVLQADEGYWAFVNDRAVGSGSLGDQSSLDAYDVAGLLRRGSNRILIEVHSRRGIGGVLAALDLGASGWVRSDASWRTSRRYEPALHKPGFVPEDMGGVRVWGSPPVGSWKVPRSANRVALLGDQLIGRKAVESARIRSLGAGEWQRRFPPADSRTALGRWVSFDLGREVGGYVNVAFAESFGARGLVYLSHGRPVGPSNAEPAAHFLAPPGRGSWTVPRPRVFQFVTVLADAEIAGLRVFETKPEWTVARAGSARSARAFSFEPPPSAATVEDEFWRELERLTGLSGRQALESFPGG